MARRRTRIDPDRFAALVEEAVAAIPEEFRRYLTNVAICIADWPTEAQLESVGLDPELDTLFGLYEGTALPDRPHDYANQLPDRITIFRGPLLEEFTSERAIRREIEVTVVHEIAHFFGLDEDHVRRLGY
ncbi:MAG TPA: metallopeptidase family protein [Candidatus Limnocylindria bacterium]|nr:metallopeptidase family protein [Candidatus Limnocylindria bacterium]